jgi:hypothetical protein
MKTKQEILAKIEETKSDSRLSYPIATIQGNAIQLSLETRIQALEWVLKDE